MYFACMTKQEYSTLLQALAQDERSAGFKIQAHACAKDDLAAVLHLRNGHRFLFSTLGQFNRWYTNKLILSGPSRP
jgi:hypothetical protein